MSEPVLCLEDFSLVRDGRILISGKKWSAERGSRILLTGKSGSGKSSFLLALAGLTPEHAPGLELRGKQTGQSRTGMVFQNPYSQLVCPTLDDEIAFALENAAWESEPMAARVKELKSFFELNALGDRAPWTFSGGEAQRVALAAVLSAKPELILLDEPLGYLDENSARAFVASASAEDRSATWIVVDHNPAAWAAWADIHYRLADDGKLIRESVPVYRVAETRPAPPVPGEIAPAVLEVSGLRAGYGKGADVLSDFSLTLEEGETVAIVGASGSGKSTFFRCLTGQLPLRSGTIKVDGQPYRPRKRHSAPFAWVPQVSEHYFLYPTVREEWSSALEAARAFGLEHLAERHPFTISEGEKRRLNLASALGTGRRVLLLDEPQFGLDRASRETLETALAELRAQGQAMLIISHEADFCARVAHRSVTLNGGTGQ